MTAEEQPLRQRRLGPLLFLGNQLGEPEETLLFGNHADFDRKSYMESRCELWALLFGRHERIGAASSCAKLAGIDSFWRRVAAFACPVITQLQFEDMHLAEYLTPDPHLGFAARIGASCVGLAGLRVVDFDFHEGYYNDIQIKYRSARLVEALTLVSQHCTDLRALRVSGYGGGEFIGPIGPAIDKILRRCSELRILYLMDCADYVPEPVAGRTYALTHMYNGCLFYAEHDVSVFQAWVRQAPDLSDYGATCYQGSSSAMDFLEAAASMPNLKGLDLHGAPAEGFLEGDLAEVPEAFDLSRVRRVLAALPEGLQICPPGQGVDPGAPDFHEDVREAIEGILGELGRDDVGLLGGGGDSECWNWVYETSPFY